MLLTKYISLQPTILRSSL